MPLGTEVDLGPGNIVLDGDSTPPFKKGGHSTPPSKFWPMYCGQMAAWVKMTLGMEVDLSPRHTVLHGAQLPAASAPPPERGTATPLFSAMSVVAKWLPISASAELLYYIILYVSVNRSLSSELSIFTSSIAQSATCRYLIYSMADFEVFHPAGATRCTDWVPFSVPNFTPIDATVRV